MTKKQLLPLLLALSLVFSLSELLAQDIYIGTTTPSVLYACGDAVVFEVELTNFGHTTLPSGLLRYYMPNGMEYIESSVEGEGISEENIYTPHRPSFSLPPLVPCETYTIQLSARKGCEELSEDEEFINDVFVQVEDNFFSATTTPYNIYFPIPAISKYEFYIDSTDWTARRYIEITNNGFGPVYGFEINDNVQEGFYQIETTNNGSVDSDGITFVLGASDFMTVGNGDGKLDFEETIKIHQEIGLLQCYKEVSELTFSWNCHNRTCSLTDSYTEEIKGKGEPSLKWWYEDNKHAGFCEDGFASIIIKNTGYETKPNAGTAYDIVFTTNHLSCMTKKDFHINNNPIEANLMEVNSIEIYELTMDFTTDPDGPGGLEDLDGDDFFDDLAIGDSILLNMKVDLDVSCTGGRSCGNTEPPLRARTLRLDSKYKDDCGVEKNLLNFRYEISENFTHQIGRPVTSRFLRPRGRISGGNSYFHERDTMTFQIRWNHWLAGTANTCTNDAFDLFINFSNDISFLEGSQPVLFNWDDNMTEEIPLDYYLENGNTLVIPYTANLANLNPNFDTSSLIQILFLAEQCEQNMVSGISEDCCEVEACYTPPPQSISYNLKYYCNQACEEAFNYSCTVGFYIDCDDSGNSVSVKGGLIATDINIIRQSLGWTDSTMTTRVDSNNPNLFLNNALDYDTVKIEMPIQIRSDGPFSDIELIINREIPTYFTPFQYNLDFYNIEENRWINCSDVAVCDTCVHYTLPLDAFFENGNCLEGINLSKGDSMVFSVVGQVDGFPRYNSFGDLLTIPYSDVITFSGQTNYTEDNCYRECICPEATLGLHDGLARHYINITMPGCSGGNLIGCNIASAHIGYRQGKLGHNKYHCAYDYDSPIPEEIAAECEIIFPPSPHLICPDFTKSPIDPFPNEFRPLSRYNLMPIDIPKNIEYIEGSSRLKLNYLPNEPLCSDSFYLKTRYINIADPVITNYGKRLTWNTSDWPVPDLLNNSIYEIIFDFEPNCYKNENLNITLHRYITDSLYYQNAGSYAAESLTLEAEGIRVNVKKPTFEANNDSIATWVITATHPTTEYNSNYTDPEYIIYNNWIAFEMPDEMTETILLEQTATGMDTLELERYGTSNKYWAKLDTIGGEQIRTFHLETQFSGCEPLALLMRYGQNCNGYPTNPQEGYEPTMNHCISSEERQELYINPKRPQILMDFLEAPDSIINICEPIDYELHILNGQVGWAIHPLLTLNLPLEGLHIIEGTTALRFSDNEDWQNISTIESTTDSTLTWDLSNFFPDGLMQGIQDTAYHDFYIKFQLAADCNFTNRTYPSLKFSSQSACGGDYASNYFYGKPLFFPEEDLLGDNYDIDLKIKSNNPCIDGSELLVTIKNLNPDMSSGEDFIRLYLQDEFGYKNGSTEGMVNSPAMPEPNTRFLGEMERLEWQIPAGITPNDSMQYSIQLENDCAYNCNLADLIVEITRPLPQDCPTAANGTCDLATIIKRTDFLAKPLNPQFVFEAMEATSIPLNSGEEEVTFEAVLSNVNEVIFDEIGLMVEFFQDLNGNGEFDEGDEPLGGLSSHTAAVLISGENMYFNTTKIVPIEQLCSMMAVIRPEMNDCICYPTVIKIPEPQFAVAGPDQSLCLGETLQLGYEATEGYSYNWLPNPRLSATDIANPVYTFEDEWNNDEPFTEMLIVEVNRTDGCTEFVRDTIVVQVSNLEVGLEVEDVNCEGDSTGSINLFPTVGIGPFNYEWLHTTDTFSEQTGLNAGIYESIITDGLGCQDTLIIQINEPEPIAFSLEAENPSCHEAPDGQLMVMGLTGGIAPYTYLWSNGATTAQISELEAGAYELSISDANGCLQIQSTILESPTALQVSENINHVSCFGEEDGSITTSVLGGTSPYEYIWNTGQQVSALNNVSAGLYTVSIIDGQGCELVQEYLVQEPPLFEMTTIEQANMSCQGIADGQLIVEASGGVPPYEFAWNTGQQDSVLTNLGTGNYTVTITDDNDCQLVMEYVLTEPTTLEVDNIIQTNASCHGAADGSLIVEMIGGTTPYQYHWSTGEQLAHVSDLAAGNYLLTITDSNGCETTAEFIIEAPLDLSIHTIEQQNVDCFEDTNGQLSIETSGGTPPYEYVWNTGQTTTTMTDLSAGTYTVTLTDANDCQLISEFLITEPSILQIGELVQIDASCIGESDGSLSVETIGGTPPYSYLWNTGNTTPNLSQLASGEYQVTITDAHDCSLIEQLFIDSPPPVEIAAEVTDISCFGENDGSIAISISDGNEQNYSMDCLNFQTQPYFENLPPGFYEICLADAVNGCITAFDFEVEEPPLLNVNFPEDTTLHLGEQVLLTPELGHGQNPADFTYEWSSAETLNCANCPEVIASPMVSTIYELSIQDDNGCETTERVSITVITEGRVYIPNAFTPDGDGDNDRFTIYAGSEVVNIQDFQVFDRWGEMVFKNQNFQPNEPAHGWDGNLDNRPLNPAVFGYYAIVELVNGKVVLYKGDVTLIR